MNLPAERAINNYYDGSLTGMVATCRCYKYMYVHIRLNLSLLGTRGAIKNVLIEEVSIVFGGGLVD